MIQNEDSLTIIYHSHTVVLVLSIADPLCSADIYAASAEIDQSESKPSEISRCV